MVGGVNKKVAPDVGYMSDVGGSVVEVVRSRRLSCGHRLRSCGNYKAHQANSPLSGRTSTEAERKLNKYNNIMRF